MTSTLGEQAKAISKKKSKKGEEGNIVTGTLGKLMTSKAHPAEVATAKLSLDLVQPNPVPNRKVPGKSPSL